MEQEVFNTARRITIASPTWKRDLESIGARNVEVIYWGYDDDDFKTLSFNPSKKFVIFHAGIFGKDRFSQALFESIGELKRERPDFAGDLEIQLFGMIDQSITTALNNNGLNKDARVTGVIPRSTVLQKMADAFLLLLPLNVSSNVDGRLPGKLFEYLRAPGWILGLGPASSDVSRILADTHAGKMADIEDKVKIKAYVIEFYELYKINKYRNPDTPEVRFYSVENQTRRLASYLDEITELS
ncbi:MAG: glycosyltransferase family 4 protein [Bacteroidia bacterium]|nr:glycosyltransferase family 4 protein [Bacteroidia bacterium]